MGWIKLYRDITLNPLWQDKPFSKGQAWIDILLCASYKDDEILIGNKTVQTERGMLITSERELMERWGWSKSKVRNFLDYLVDENMVIKSAVQKKTTKKTSLSLVNYGLFQDSETGKKTIKRPRKDHEKTTSPRGEMYIYNKYNKKESKNIKNNNAHARAGDNKFHNFSQRSYSEADLEAIKKSMMGE